MPAANVDDRVVRRAVGAERAARPAGERRDLDRERRDVVRNEREAQLQRADLDDVVGRVLLRRERRVDERVVAPQAAQVAKHVDAAARGRAGAGAPGVGARVAARPGTGCWRGE